MSEPDTDGYIFAPGPYGLDTLQTPSPPDGRVDQVLLSIVTPDDRGLFHNHMAAGVQYD